MDVDKILPVSSTLGWHSLKVKVKEVKDEVQTRKGLQWIPRHPETRKFPKRDLGLAWIVWWKEWFTRRVETSHIHRDTRKKCTASLILAIRVELSGSEEVEFYAQVGPIIYFGRANKRKVSKKGRVPSLHLIG